MNHFNIVKTLREVRFDTFEPLLIKTSNNMPILLNRFVKLYNKRQNEIEENV